LAAVPPKLLSIWEKALAKAKKGSHLQVLEKMTDLIYNKHRIVENAPFVVRETKTEAGKPIREAVGLFLEQYLASLSAERKELISRYQRLDVARKVVGVGSVGTRCWIAFMRGTDQSDPLFLQVKEAQNSVLAPYLKGPCVSEPGSPRSLRTALDPGLTKHSSGMGLLDKIHFYVRQLRDMKGSYEFDPQITNHKGMETYCGLCGWALALAHAKSGDTATIAGYLGKTDEVDDALTKFAFAYSEQNERDYDELKKAARTKRIQVAEVA